MNDGLSEIAEYEYRFDVSDAVRRAARTLAKPSRDENSLVRTLARDVLELEKRLATSEATVAALSKGLS